MVRKLSLLAVLSLAAWAQVASEANSAYRSKEGRAALAAGMDSPDRDARQRPRELVEELGIRAGDTLVDLGTGPGYMLPWLSRAVGASGKVIAEDIQQDFLDHARNKTQQGGLKNVEFILGTPTDPKLPPNAVDLVMALDVYHHFDYPRPMLAAIAKSLRPGGRLAIVDYYKRPGSMGSSDPNRPLHHIRLDADDVIREVESNGYRLVSRREHTPGSQYIAIFAKVN
jgi:ubiquinone/menaquinone biosynthesis C-methylase UbiE